MYKKTIYYVSGCEEGQRWSLKVSICARTIRFNGNFIVESEDAKSKSNIRGNDRYFFLKRLSKEMFEKYEIDHDWENGARVTLKTPKEHRNTNKGKVNQRNWVEEEEWL